MLSPAGSRSELCKATSDSSACVGSSRTRDPSLAQAHAATRSYNSIPPFASANDAAVTASGSTPPSASRTRTKTSITDLGYFSSRTETSSARCSCCDGSFSSVLRRWRSGSGLVTRVKRRSHCSRPYRWQPQRSMPVRRHAQQRTKQSNLFGVLPTFDLPGSIYGTHNLGVLCLHVSLHSAGDHSACQGSVCQHIPSRSLPNRHRTEPVARCSTPTFICSGRNCWSVLLADLCQAAKSAVKSATPASLSNCVGMAGRYEASTARMDILFDCAVGSGARGGGGGQNPTSGARAGLAVKSRGSVGCLVHQSAAAVRRAGAAPAGSRMGYRTYAYRTARRG
eukprot:SAG31_NODE_7916_length_1565_cov_1.127558_2_plen_338_part_00